MIKKKLVITEKELEDIVANATIKALRGVGTQIEDDIMEYARLRKSNTGLDVDVYVDDGGAYMRYNHPLWVYIRDGRGNDKPVFHVEVSKNPIIPFSVNLGKSEQTAVLRFISQNAELLKLFADEEIEHDEFYKLCKPVEYAYCTQSSAKQQINEMATLRPKQSGLPTVLWIDEGSSPPHGPRIKFQASRDQSTTRNYTTMTISQNPEIYHLPAKSYLSSSDIQKIVNFVKANEALLLSVSCGEMTYDEFLKRMVKV